MKARLRLKNIGGLREGDYVFESGKLNIIESANSAGKTSIVKALTAILSIPRNGFLEQRIFVEAQKLGIKTDPRNPYEGFVNVHADQGFVELEFNGKNEKYVVKQSGDILTAPENSDERFLLAGVLSNNSRVLRQLRGLDELEPDDFKWVVEELSYAKRYSAESELLRTKKEDLVEKKVLIAKSLKQLEPLKQREVALERELETLDSELASLTDKFRESGKVAEDRDELLKRINTLKKEIQNKAREKENITRQQLAPKLKESKESQLQKSQVEAELKETEQEISTLRRQDLRKQKIEKEVNKLMDQRSTADGLLNLYVVAEANFRKSQGERVLCPLCEHGHIDYQSIVHNIARYRKQREELNDRILQLNQEKQNIAIQLTRAEDRVKELRKRVGELTEKIWMIGRQLKGPEEAVRAIDNLIADYNEKLEREQRVYEELNSKISKADEEVNREYNEKSKRRSALQEELGAVRQNIDELLFIEVYGMMLQPDAAMYICEKMIAILEDRIRYLEGRAEEEREEAAKRFNESINTLMTTLGFSEFRTIKLAGAPSYRLYVERYDPEKKEYKSQDVGTLSTSEKLAIALILQMALKETYMKKVPFFILDDVLEDFDSERREQVIDYLKEKVKQEGWLIIATKLVEELGAPKIRYL
ncbi:MAG: hypothetical protein H3Z53_11245 [archaeon]|nr:hypothetical protein [archaeon]MCP8314927.1 hypothetical protein [archaeon]